MTRQRPSLDDVGFGTVGPDAPLAAAPATNSEPVRVGDRVHVIIGRNRGATAEVLELSSLPTPSGQAVAMARIRRPRGGESWEFTSSLVRLDG